MINITQFPNGIIPMPLKKIKELSKHIPANYQEKECPFWESGYSAQYDWYYDITFKRIFKTWKLFKVDFYYKEKINNNPTQKIAYFAL